MKPWRVHTVADFTVGQKVWVHADQGFRFGEVTKIGRTRVTVLHPRNRLGATAERPYGMESIVVGQGEDPNDWGWGVVTAAGTWWALGRAVRRNGDPQLPRIQPMKTDLEPIEQPRLPLNEVGRMRTLRESLYGPSDSPINQALMFLAQRVAQGPTFGSLPTKWEVVNIEAVNPAVDTATLCLDLSDGTTIRLDVNRYRRILEE